MRTLKTAITAATIFLVLAAAAFAQAAATTAVVVPIGNWAAESLPAIAEILGTLITIIVAWALRFLPSAFKQYITATMVAQAEQVLQRAIDYGIAAIAGATKDRQLTVDVSNSVIASALQYVISHAPDYLITWMGGEAKIVSMIIARLVNLLPDSSKVVNSSIVAAPMPPGTATTTPVSGA